jgi:hypothetical protein
MYFIYVLNSKFTDWEELNELLHSKYGSADSSGNLKGKNRAYSKEEIEKELKCLKKVSFDSPLVENWIGLIEKLLL